MLFPLYFVVSNIYSVMYIWYIPFINLLNASSKEKIKDNLFGFAVFSLRQGNTQRSLLLVSELWVNAA